MTRHPVTHLRDLRLCVNAGITIPLCKASARLLDMDAGRLPTTTDPFAVTCKRCLAVIRRRMEPRQ